MDEQNTNPDPTPPKEEDFIDLFEEMVNLLKFALDNSDNKAPGILPKDLEDKLARLESDVVEFCQVNSALVEEVNKDSKIVPVDPLEAMSPRERDVYERSQKLLLEAEEKRKAIEIQLEEAKASGQLNLEDLDSPDTRKKKFKRFGMRKKWNKL